jgi:hypothetical protein
MYEKRVTGMQPLVITKISFYVKVSKNPSREGRVIKGHCYLGSSLLYRFLAF